mmetsp:Transcript_16534/g.52708  ORF Transcript_16534/g.52708 Transcript_16534/m.52708 type:complete len:235 (+) Transcript_16534:750-1454(+)
MTTRWRTWPKRCGMWSSRQLPSSGTRAGPTATCDCSHPRPSTCRSGLERRSLPWTRGCGALSPGIKPARARARRRMERTPPLCAPLLCWSHSPAPAASRCVTTASRRPIAWQPSPCLPPMPSCPWATACASWSSASRPTLAPSTPSSSTRGPQPTCSWRMRWWWQPSSSTLPLAPCRACAPVTACWCRLCAGRRAWPRCCSWACDRCWWTWTSTACRSAWWTWRQRQRNPACGR